MNSDFDNLPTLLEGAAGLEPVARLLARLRSGETVHYGPADTSFNGSSYYQIYVRRPDGLDSRLRRAYPIQEHERLLGFDAAIGTRT